MLFGVVAAPAFAQEEVEPTEPPAVEETTPAPEADTGRERITITGSRIARDEFSSSSPVQVITTESSALQGLVSASEILQTSSVAAGSGQINNTFTGFVVDGGGGVDTISLRGLGAQRSLVLLNGRRTPPAGVGGTVGPVDLNILPNSIINRFEILKDGASSIYGSDAVAGVVNVITRDNVEGGEIGGSLEITEQGGAEEYVIYGQKGWVNDTNSFNISAEWYRQEPLTIGDRDNLACPQDYVFSQADGSRADAIDSRTGEIKCFSALEGYVQTFNPFTGAFFGSRVFDPTSTTTGSEGVPGWRFIPFFERSYDDPRELSTTAISPRERATVFASGEFRPDALGGAEFYTELMAHRRESSQDNWRQLFPWFDGTSPVNAFNTTVFGVGLDARPIVLIPFDSSQEVNLYRGLGGLRGEFDNGWSWDAYLSHSISQGEYTRDVVPEDRVDAGTGTLQLSITPNPDGVCGPSAPAGCVPLDLFRPEVLFDGVFSPEEAAYYLLQETGTTDYTQTIFEGVVTGDLFSMPDGPVGAAFGVHVRHDTIDDQPGEFSVAGNAWGLLTAGRTEGEDTVSEVFGEVELPLARNRPLMEDVTLNMSGRYSSYDSVGDATTYKVGLNWQINSVFRARATQGTSFRAPALFELFLADQTSFLQQQSVDPCINYGALGEDGGFRVDEQIRTNCALDGLAPTYGGAGASAEIVRGGGSGRLDPEESEALTVGFVVTPQDFGLSFAVDYFQITIENQIGSFAAGVVGACYSDPDFRSQPGFCDFFTRELDPTAPNFGQITDIDASYLNIPSQETSGFDYSIRYEHEFNFGELVVDSQITNTQTDETQLFEGSDVLELSGLIGEPEWVGNVQSRFQRGDWTTTWTLNYTGESSNLGYEGEDGIIEGSFIYGGQTVNTIAEVDPFITHDLSVRREFDTWTLAVGARNIFDEEAPLISEGDDLGSAQRLGTYPLSSQYIDGYIGRQYFMTVNKTF